MSYAYGGYGGGGYGAPPPSGGGYGAPPPQQYGGGGYGVPPPQQYGGGGYGVPPPQQAYGQPPGPPPGAFGGASRGPPPGTDPAVWNCFISVDTDQSGSIDTRELSRALVNGDWTPFDSDTIKMLQHQFSKGDGRITFQEFSALYAYIQQWSGCFRQADRDRSGSIDERELGSALSNFGFNLPPETLHLVVKKYTPAGGRQGITFDLFVRACVVVKSLTEGFQRFDPQRRGYAQMSYKDFLETCLKAP